MAEPDDYRVNMSGDQFDVANELEGTAEEGDSPMLNLVDIWDSSREPFDEWVGEVSRAFYESEFGIEAAAQLLDTSSGELAAVLRLATMEDECLELLNEEIPPKTTWFALAEASKEEVEIAMEALQDMSAHESPHSVVKRAIREHRGPTPEERVAELPGEVFFHMATKAKQYDLLYGKARSFLFDIGKYKSSGSGLSPKQADWAHDLLKQMAEQGAISRDSPDDDQEECDLVLDALGK